MPRSSPSTTRQAPAGLATPVIAPVAPRTSSGADAGPLRWSGYGALAGTIVALVLLAWLHRNVVDDAFIMLRYAENLVNGHGLVWNPGDRVEGYTNFLATLAFAAGLGLGLEPIAFSHAFNLAFLVLSLLLFWGIARRVLGSNGHALVATGLLGANFTFSSSGTQGLGTHMQTAALLAATALLARLRDRPTLRETVGFSLLGVAAVLVRMDSLLPLGVLFVVAIAALRRTPARLAGLLLPGGVVLAAWLGWRWSTYGDLLPNTYYVKVTSVGATVAGLHYLYLFLLSYLLFPHLVVVVAALRRIELPADWLVAVSCAVVALWSAYVVRIGGDFIEFRLLAPVLPFLFIAIYWSVLRVVPDGVLRWGLLGLVALGSLHHQLAFERLRSGSPVIRPSLRIVSVPDDAERPPILWSELETGRYLGEAFGHDPEVRLAIGAAGVIPFYSKLGFVDVMGLNDAWVARHGTPVAHSRFVGGLWPAHVRIATLDHLLDRGVHLFVGAGSLVREDVVASASNFGDLLTLMLAGEPDLTRAFAAPSGEFPPETSVVEIPVRPGYRLLALYLTRSPRVDAVIESRGWRSHPIARFAERGAASSPR